MMLILGRVWLATGLSPTPLRLCAFPASLRQGNAAERADRPRKRPRTEQRQIDGSMEGQSLEEFSQARKAGRNNHREEECSTDLSALCRKNDSQNTSQREKIEEAISDFSNGISLHGETNHA